MKWWEGERKKGILIFLSTVVAILLVLVSWFSWLQTHPQIIVGYEKVSFNINFKSLIFPEENITATAVTYINYGQGTMSLDVEIPRQHHILLLCGGIYEAINFTLTASFMVGLSPSDFVFHSVEIENSACNHPDVYINYSQTFGVNRTYHHERSYCFEKGSRDVRIDFKPEGQVFKITGQILWDIEDFRINGYTLRIEGICTISSIEVPVIVDIDAYQPK